MKNNQKTLNTISAFNILTDQTTPRVNGLSAVAGSVCQDPKPQPANVCWPKYLRRCENCHALMWRLKSGKWTHRKSEWRNETQNH